MPWPNGRYGLVRALQVEVVRIGVVLGVAVGGGEAELQVLPGRQLHVADRGLGRRVRYLIKRRSGSGAGLRRADQDTDGMQLR